MIRKEPNKLEKERDTIKQQLIALQEEGHRGRDKDGESSRKPLEYQYLHSLTPVGWGAYAKTLKIAADAVLVEFEKSFGSGPYLPLSDIDTVYIYLIGIAIENLLKGIYVARNPLSLDKKQVENKKGGYRLPEKLGRHSLSYFAKKSDIDFTPDESMLIESLEFFVNRLGKYLVPKTSADYIEVQFKYGAMPHQEYPSFDFKKFCTDANILYIRCQGIIETEIRLWGKGIDY